MSRYLPFVGCAALALAACQAPSGPLRGAVLPPARFALEVLSESVPVAVAATPSAVATAPAPAPPTAAADTVPSPAATQGPPSGSGGSGGGAPAPPQTTGRVLVFGPAADLPLEGARVATSDGRSAITLADGSFVLPGPAPADGVYVASRAGYATLLMAGLAPGPVQLALQPRGGSAAQGPQGVKFVVHGRLVRPGGDPVPDAFVALGDTHGTDCVPAVSGADGLFDMQVTAPAGAVVDGTLLAAARNGAFLGLASGVTVSAKLPALAPLAMVAADHPVDVTLDSHLMGAIDVPQAIDMTAADGTRLGIALHPGTARLAALPGVRYSYRAEAVDPANGTTSNVYVADLPIDFADPATHLSAALLAPPALTLPPALVPDARIAWTAVDGADGYHLSFTGKDAVGFAWEGFTAGTGLPLTLPEPLPAGHYDLVLAALDGAARIPRSLASLVGPAPVVPSYRKSTRRLDVTI